MKSESINQKKESGYKVLNVQCSTDEVLTAQIKIPAESEWFTGHFPGNPILPGIAQMGMVFDLMKQAMNPCLILKEFKRVRFKQLIRPDSHITVVVQPQVKETGTFSFRLLIQEDIVCSGFIRVKE